MELPANLSQAIGLALNADVPEIKAQCARACHRKWQNQQLNFDFSHAVPDRPARPEKPELLHPAQMPKRRKAGSTENRIALLHAVCHIELNAIDLALDIVGRFGMTMPQDFTTDWLKVADDEARHFQMVQDRLKDMGSLYGALPAHDGLWESSMATANDLAARLAIVPMVLEARGLDVTPSMIERFEKFGDQQSADILKIIYTEEVSHVATGTKWFRFLAKQQNMGETEWFQKLVQKYFKGLLKRPFNIQARDKANFPFDWYDPLADLLKTN